jgi:23S rRNA pseudouridine1911/1915/1917 synthase
LLRFKLDTGRTHQIRVHCAHIHHPVVGDITYSRCRKLPLDLPGQALHAFQLGLDHPITKVRMLFEAPVPLVMEKLLTVLRNRSA